MADSTLDFVTQSGGTQLAVQPRVYVRERWGQPWRLEPTIKCSAAGKQASPGTSSATLQRRFGPVQEPNGQWWVRTKIDIRDWYVRVEIPIDSDDPAVPAARYFYGRITEEVDRLDGAGVLYAGGPQATGVQVWGARDVGMIAAMRTPIDKGYIVARGAGVQGLRWIQRGLRFNDPRLSPGEEAPFPNRQVAGEKFDGAWDFEDQPTIYRSAYWSTRDVIEHLVTRFPLGRLVEVGLPAIPTRLSLDSSAAWILAPKGSEPIDRPTLDTDGLTLRDCLEGVLARQRFFGFCWQYDPTDVERGRERIQLDVFRFTAFDVHFASGALIRKNPRRKVLDLTGALDLADWRVTKSTLDRFDRVVAVGARQRVAFTVSKMDGNLEAGWTTNAEHLYLQGASERAGYGAEDVAEQQRLNEEARGSDRVAAVYQQFRVPDAWDGRAGIGLGGEKSSVQGSDFARLSMRALSRLPFTAELVGSQFQITEHRESTLPGYLTIVMADNAQATRYALLGRVRIAGLGVYSGDHWVKGTYDDELIIDVAWQGAAAAVGATVSEIPRGEELRPMAFLRVDGRWRPLDQVPSWVENVDGEPGKDWTGSVQPLDGDLAVELKIQGAFPHVIAGDAELLDVDDATQADWETGLAVTLAIEGDRYAEGYWSAPGAFVGDTPKVLRIEVGDAARLDYVAPATAAGGQGLEDGLFSLPGGYVRDDRPLLAEIARIAGEWYLRERRAVEVRLNKIYAGLEVGDLLVSVKTAAGEVSTGSIVTDVEWDFVAQTTTIRTDYGELDASQLLYLARGGR